jgi:hypothetical protein
VETDLQAGANHRYEVIKRDKHIRKRKKEEEENIA